MSDLNANYAASGFGTKGKKSLGANPALMVIDVCEVRVVHSHEEND